MIVMKVLIQSCKLFHLWIDTVKESKFIEESNK